MRVITVKVICGLHAEQAVPGGSALGARGGAWAGLGTVFQGG